MNRNQVCPICDNAYNTTATVAPVDHWYRANCPICGRFEVYQTADDDFLDPKSPVGRKLTVPQRARIAHKVRSATLDSRNLPRLTSEMLQPYIEAGCPGPSPGEQVIGAIRYIGDETNRTGKRIGVLPNSFFVIIGAPTPIFADELLLEMKNRGLVDGAAVPTDDEHLSLEDVKLTLAGWAEYEKEKKGKIAGLYGFVALKFGEPELELLISSVLKPVLKEKLNFEVRDMRDVAQAGVIDNIMRAQIRDAAFVIADLTHDNSGSYWEAGYAEGLGKPVIYICEQKKFDAAKTHFDTNHCTTIMWSSEGHREFAQQLVATVRRSLNLF